MTDAIAALAAVNAQRARPSATALFARFEAKWRDEPLVLDKWFALQATSRARGHAGARADAAGASEVQRPQSEPACARWWGRSRCRNWPSSTPRDGSGYAFVADAGAGARPRSIRRWRSTLAGAFNLWRRFAEPRRALQRAALRRDRRAPELSPDVTEVVTRALAD